MLVSTFTLGDLYLGIDIILVREINRSMECTPVPGAPNYIRGMLNIRGRVITLFDLKNRLSWSDDPRSGVFNAEIGNDGKPAKQYNVILKTRSEVAQIDRDIAMSRCPWSDPVGLVVDQLGDVRDIVDDTILPSPANLRGISADFVHGVVEFERNLLVILDVAQVLGFEQNAA
ncbi:CheW protein [Magnetococcus marinus MC-1]|uniref:CheW protein n=1 Tax=Magnetococcus marinus (strain ATCC BAA-1437 / JCM 17883 / MC-1) TaxID=156889 RepID=A0LDL9_MAGMM|nr:chemotaxis protein CheW [Magnetococcus marinus]ABK46062.1 CheW protein [Magnetococcus marinus MC-1]